MSDLYAKIQTTRTNFVPEFFQEFTVICFNEQTNQLHVHVHDINWGVLNHAPQLKSRNCYNYHCAMLIYTVCMRLCVVIVCVGGGGAGQCQQIRLS